MNSVEAMAANGLAISAGKRVRLLLLVLGTLALMAAGARGHAQSQMGAGTPLGSVRGFPEDSGPFATGNDPGDSVEAEKRMNALNADRQKSLVSDTAKLLKLATELNQQIAKSNSGELTPEQLRMVAEIEKLAHNVRDKMAMSLRGPQFPGIDTPLQPFPSASHH